MNQIIEYIINMFPFILISLPIILLWRWISIRNLKKNNKKTTVFHEVGIIVFLLFLIGLGSQVLAPKFELMENGIDISYILKNVNIIPFKVFADTYKAVFKNNNINYFLINFLGNIIMFMPIGFAVPLLFNKIKTKKILLIGFCCSLFIELCQLPIARKTDIDDLWLNTLGVFFGYCLYVLLNKFFSQFFKKFKIRSKE